VVGAGGQRAAGVAPVPERLLQVRRGHAGVARKPLRDADVLRHQGELEARGEGAGEDLLRDLALGGAVLAGGGVDHVHQRLRVEAERLADEQCLEAGDGARGAEVIVERLGGVPGPHLAAVEEVGAHLLEHRPHARDVGFAPAHHDGERAVARLGDRARHGRIHHRDAARGELLRQAPGRRRVRRAHVHHHRAALQGRQRGVDRILHGLAVRHHGDEHVRALRGGARRDAAARLRLVPGLQPEAGAREVRRHELAHAAEADESHDHARTCDPVSRWGVAVPRRRAP